MNDLVKIVWDYLRQKIGVNGTLVIAICGLLVLSVTRIVSFIGYAYFLIAYELSIMGVYVFNAVLCAADISWYFLSSMR